MVTTPNLQQQLVETATENFVQKLSLQKDTAFLRVVYGIVLNRGLTDFDPSDVVDGGQDKQIDIIAIDQDKDEATAHIVNVKNEHTFSSNILIQLRNGLTWVFAKSKKDVQGLKNPAFADRILDVRASMLELSTSNLKIHVKYVTNGLTSRLAPGDEVFQELKTILQEYDNGTFAEFKCQLWGAEELIAETKRHEKTKKKVDAKLGIQYDVNVGSLVRHTAGQLRGVICTTSGEEIAKLVDADPTGAIFDSNIRRFLGTRGSVNTDILNTCSNSKLGHQFWFLNNGITIVCDQFAEVPLPDQAHIDIKNVQIVNGCQTAMSIAEAYKKGQLSGDVRVLARIYQTADSKLEQTIVRTTNNQNKISTRDLRSNDSVQVDMEQAFAKYDLYYERKARQFDSAAVPATAIVSNETVGQSYLGIVLRKPSDARRRKYKIWSELYDSVFAGAAIESHVLATLIYKIVDAWLESSGKTKHKSELTRKLAKNAAFHIARMVPFTFLGGDNWSDPKALAARIKELSGTPDVLYAATDDALKALTKIVQKQVPDLIDLDAYLKSSSLDEEIDKYLYKSKKVKAAKASQ